MNKNVVMLTYNNTNAELAALNPTLAKGQEVIVSGIAGAIEVARKVGDGTTNYNSLQFIGTLKIGVTANIDITVAPYNISGNLVQIINVGAGAITITKGATDTLDIGVGTVITFINIAGTWYTLGNISTLNSYDPNFNYSINDIIQNGGQFFISLANNNKGNALPGADTVPPYTNAYWKVLDLGGSVAPYQTLGEDFTIRQVGYLSTDGKVYVADATNFAGKSIIGFALSAGVTDDEVKFITNGELTGFTGLTVGARYFLSTAGDIVAEGAMSSEGMRVFLGIARNATTLNVNVGFAESVNKLDDRANIGEVKYTATYDAAAMIPQGWIPFSFGNQKSQTLYPALYAKIGDRYNAQHVAAGDTAVASGYFYPTPIPGDHARIAIPDVVYASTDVSGNALINISHGILRTGTAVLLVGDDIPAPLVSGTIYYVIVNSATSISFAETEVLAIAGTAITLTDSGTGSFRLTQEGIRIDSAGQLLTGVLNFARGDDSQYNIVTSVGSGGIVKIETVSGTVTGYDALGSGNIQRATIDTSLQTDSKQNSNEFRGSASYVFAWIKAEYVTPAGEPVSALRWDSGWISKTGFTSLSLSILHQLGANLSELNVRLLLSSDGTDDTSFEVQPISIDSSTGANRYWGHEFHQVSQNELLLRTAVGGLVYLDGVATAPIIIDTETFYYKVVVEKPVLYANYADAPARQSYDITDANDVIVTLPDAAECIEEREYWWNCTSTGKLLFYDAANTAYLDYEGEGEGNIVLAPVGGVWKVKTYEDSGSNANGKWRKFKDGWAEVWGGVSATLSSTVSNFLASTSGTSYYGNATWSFPITAAGIPDAENFNFNIIEGSTPTIAIRRNTSAAITVSGIELLLLSKDSGAVKASVHGKIRWKA